MLDYLEVKSILNYITNLQKENEILKEKVHNQKLAIAYSTIQNDKLQTRLKTYKRRKTAETQKKRIYKQRNEKAIEYIEKYLHEHVIDEFPDEQSTFYDEKDRFIPNAKEVLLNILQGGDE